MSATDVLDAAKRSVATLLAPFLAFVAICLLLRYVAGVRLGAVALTSLQNLLGAPDSSSLRFLKQTEIVKLFPVVLFFALLCLLILLGESIRRIAQVLPPQITLHAGTLTARLGSLPHTLALWNANPKLDLHQVLELVDLRVSQFAVDHPVHQQTITQWSDDAAARMRAFDVFKVLVYFCLFCILYRVIVGTSSELSPWYVCLLFLSLVAAALVSLVQSLHCTYQAHATRMKPWSHPDDSWNGQPDVTTTQERLDALSSVALPRWWRWRATKAGSLDHYWDLVRGGSV